jgi:hypothetical protein
MRPNYRLTPCCRNCKFYGPAPGSDRRQDGQCLVLKESQPDSKLLRTHATCVCDAHIFKSVNMHVHAICIKYKAELPEDL